MSQRAFTPEQDVQLAAAYRAGASIHDLSSRHGASCKAVRQALIRAGQSRRPGGRGNRWSPEVMTEALSLYREGASVKDLARHYRVRSTVISQVLADSGIDLHLGGRPHPKLRSEKQATEIADRYATGVTIVQLADEYNCSSSAIRRAIERGGGTIRPAGTPTFWTQEREQEVVARYLDGSSQAEIAAHFGVSQGAVSARLRKHGISIRGYDRRGSNHHSWKGGRHLISGYVYITPTDDDLQYCKPNASGKVAEHRLVMGRAVGRRLTDGETVHHINGNRTDNRLENLQLRRGHHGTGVVMRCADCGSHNIVAVEIAT